MEVYMNPDCHMTLKSLIAMYEDLIAAGKMSPHSAGASRLDVLRAREIKRRKWYNTPYAKRKFMQNPNKQA